MSCDLFSFGMILIEIYTCELPYADVPEMMVNVRIATGQVRVFVYYNIQDVIMLYYTVAV